MTKVFLVGGAVRDNFLGTKSKDLDFVVMAKDFASMTELVTANGCRVVQSKPEFGTIRAIHPTLGGVDFALPRADSEHDGRKCKTEQVQTIEQDLARRDFTMNAIAVMCGDENDWLTPQWDNVVDPFDGMGAIARKEIQFVGNASERIAEDELRILRAMRFSVTLGFTMSKETADAVMVGEVTNKVSADRIFTELNKMSEKDSVATVLTLVKFKKENLLTRLKVTFSGK